MPYRHAHRGHRILTNQLLDTGLFSHLSEAQLAHLTEHAHEFTYPAQITMLAAGAIPHLALVILGGSAHHCENGRVVGTVGHGSVVYLEEAVTGRRARYSLVSEVPVRGVAVKAALLTAALTPQRATHASSSSVLAMTSGGRVPLANDSMVTVSKTSRRLERAAIHTRWSTSALPEY